jgi:hypothetical protein
MKKVLLIVIVAFLVPVLFFDKTILARLRERAIMRKCRRRF